MQEELEHRTVTLMVSSGKFTGKTLKSAMMHFLNYSKHKVQEHKAVVPHGKQTVKQLVGQNAGVENVEIGDDINLRSFNRIARKYGVDYAVKKVEKDGKPQFLVFFKSRDKDAITSAMKEYIDHFVEHAAPYAGRSADEQGQDKETDHYEHPVCSVCSPGDKAW